MAGIIKGKDIVDHSVSKEKLNFEILIPVSVDEDLSVAGSSMDLPLDNTGLIIRAEYRDSGITDIKAIAVSEPVIADIRRMSVYGDSSQGYSGDGLTYTTTGTVIDDVYKNSNDTVIINIRIKNNIYQVWLFFSGNGERSTMWYIKIK